MFINVELSIIFHIKLKACCISFLTTCPVPISSREKSFISKLFHLMTIIYNFIATSVLGIPLEKVYGFITYSNVLSIDYKIKSSTYLLILFKLACLYT